MKHHNPKRNKAKSLYIWHRYSGLFAALFVIFVTATGIALNHTDGLALKSYHISSSLILDRYQVKNPGKTFSFNSNGRIISQADDLLFVGANTVIPVESDSLGAIEFKDWLLIALTDEILLIDSTDQRVGSLNGADGVPKNIHKIGVDDQGQVKILANGQVYHLKADFSIEKSNSNVVISWSKAAPVSDSFTAEINQRYRSNIISLETLVLDIHSGRFFGSYGALFFDFIGIILLFLSITGVIIWLRQRKGHHNK